MSHKAHAAGAALLCLTGCEPNYDLGELTDDQRKEVQEAIEQNREDLAIYSELIARAEPAATFGANKEKTKEAFGESLLNAQELAERYMEEGRIYTFVPNDGNTIKDAAGFFHTAVSEEDNYMAFLVSTNIYGDQRFASFPSGLLHEGIHDEQPGHTDEVEDLLMASEVGWDKDPVFAEAVEQKSDYAYLISLLGVVPVEARIASLGVSREEAAGFAEAVGYDQDRMEDYYRRLMSDPLASDQLAWATGVADTYADKFVALRTLGINREELIDVLAHETSIYPEAHAEYLGVIREFRAEYLSEKSEGKEAQNEKEYYDSNFRR